mmetsp:Transcript_71871/g.208278  ORF Transcript_71871/g.208278 Transcript_71871/m.208278 type:complete len:303 (-) Transcript_71871:114-1022(-)
MSAAPAEPKAAKAPSSRLWKGFVTGSIGAAVGGSCAHPLDLLKVRMQLQTETPKLNMGQMFLKIGRTEGPSGLFKGVDASAARQLVYSGTRFGMYEVLKKAAGGQDGGLSTVTKAVCAAASGAMGAFAGNPGDLAMVRMQADGKLPLEQRRNYKNVFDAVARIARSEGALSMWSTGVVPNMNRAAVITVGQLAAYDACKEALLEHGCKDSVPTHFGASFIAAFIASVLSNPVDVAKTRLMNQRPELGGVVYTGTMNAMTTMVRTEGPVALYKGFAATFSRQLPYVMITWMTVEQLKKVMKHL